MIAGLSSFKRFPLAWIVQQFAPQARDERAVWVQAVQSTSLFQILVLAL
jgi:hypothetical protein